MQVKVPDLRVLANQYFNPATVVEDVVAGVVFGVESVPDGLAGGLLAAVNPIYGLYGYMVGTFTGAFFTSSVFMSVQATGAMALVVASVPRVTGGMTFIASLLIPLQYAVLIGVAMSVLLYVVQQSNKITIKRWIRPEGKLAVEIDPPATIPPDQITLLVPYGSLFFASVPLFESQLPEVTADSTHAVVILNLRGETDLGSTFLAVIDRYARALQAQGSKLMLAGVAPEVRAQITRTGLIETIGHQNVYLKTDNLGESLFNAWADAERWLEMGSAAGKTA